MCRRTQIVAQGHKGTADCVQFGQCIDQVSQTTGKISFRWVLRWKTRVFYSSSARLG
jgi:hypothetical protein